ncbi:phospholipase D-like domain-containing protein [Metapseudomonas furukawaii]|uniref:Probable phospholipase protein n=1 Tax=Metapseudomonas furukawaii TaxID=1149133 RepID=A0AAD1C4L2_METFU|nr:phospholipase D-like domain-containing protein [Pseudomonas furukawaii]ELS24982.1 putative phospholipase protein [Pseudomonas furukawaii]BAU76401.1 probable phospholipase protein [Pseudomonas furukawaii]
MTIREIVVPLSLQHTQEVMCTSPWFVSDTEYRPRPATYRPLINGEEAFRAVHEAIARATRSVDIICWGFQPSMYFIRDGNAPCIGELLMAKAKDRKNPVRVRILGWEMIGNTAGFADEANLPGKRPHLWDRAGQSSTDEQYAYDREWFSKCAAWDGQAAAWTKPLPVFVSRGFDPMQRAEIAYRAALNSLDPDLSMSTIGTLAGTVTHHQKTVLVDYEVPELAVGFVMGHNMLDEYWDTDQHSAWGRTYTDRPAPDRGARGHLPRQDISSRVTGPILAHLHHNFATAWRRETGEDLFVTRQAASVAEKLALWEKDPLIMGQLLRTQAQEGKRDIERAYLQAINNATQFIYIENQYFRWPPLADAIIEAAKVQTNNGRDPGLHGALHLFVITNVTDGGIGAGTVNTQRMLERLGREETIPEITKLRRIDQAKQRAAELEPAWHERAERKVLEAMTSLSDTLGGTQLGDKAREARQQAAEAARQRAADLEAEIEQIKRNPVNRPPERPGLKVHICSLVSGDSPANDWVPVYIHSKLMIVDDVFTTHGSANINTRSMQVDSELNIAHEWHEVTQAMRRRLWNLHTAGQGGQDNPKDAFMAWEDLIRRNKERQSKDLPPDTPLVEFLYDKPTLSNLD